MLGFAAGLAQAQPYPNRPIKLVVPYAPGQGTDVLSRTIAERVATSLGQPIVVENRPGAGANIGADFVAKAPADGYTLLMGTNATHAMNAAMYPSLSFDPVKDFAPVMLVGTLPMLLSAGPQFQAAGLREIIAMAKAKPGSINVALPSTTARVVVELLKQNDGIDLFGVAYKGSGAALTDLIGGQVQLMVDTVTASMPQVASGKIRAIAVTTGQRTELAPGVPTFAESGVPGFDLVAWNALFAPRGTPSEAVNLLNAEIAKALAQPEVRARLMRMGFEPGGGSPDRLRTFVESETQRWGQAIRKAGIKAD
jgi:tripartite-type tricarboxylate transporter receptor subunit TctC